MDPLVGISFLRVEIEIGIEIDAVGRLFLSNVVSSSAETAEHCCHAVEFILAVPALRFLQRLADNQHILNRRAFKRRATGNFEITPSISFRSLAVSFSDIERYRLASPKPLIPCGSMNSVQTVGLFVNPCNIAYRKTIDIQFLVSKPISSIPIAIPISIIPSVQHTMGEDRADSDLQKACASP